MAPRTSGRRSNRLRVLAVDEDAQHANYMRAVLPQYNFHVTVHTSPVVALNFLKDHAEDVDFLLVAVNMEEISGLQFLDIATKMRRNVQVIMMSTTTTMDIMMRCAALGAKFVVKKPLESYTICNLWQHLDLGTRRLEIIRNLIQGPTSVITDEGESSNSSGHQIAKSMNKPDSEVQSSIGSNTVAMGPVNRLDTHEGETLEKGPRAKQYTSAGTPPEN